MGIHPNDDEFPEQGCVTVNAANRKHHLSKIVSDGQRLSVRLPPHIAGILAARCDETGQNPSEMVRKLLVTALVGKDGELLIPPVYRAGEVRQASYRFPSTLVDLLPRYRAFGEKLWPERRRLFRELLAASEVAAANGVNPLDQKLCSELVRLWRRYRLV